VLPSESFVAVLVVGGLLALGGLFFLGLLLLNRESLETEPGNAGALKR
jgi:hypothetical protein